MNTPIYTSRDQAITAAKIRALSNLPITTDQTNEDQWLVKDTSCNCNCGETNAVRVTFFDDENDKQYDGIAGYCDACGK